ncbi:CopG family ribbon-helix-helix protein [Desulfovibrio psychrotolerans]|uniref:YacA n=2 Tax=Desulfovibrio psychrotolerans TaxID=415242 RepID=A0A7J0BY82_9BACT|nr:hypothetical protein [Desulfovibrio psychrotolerans]GFM38657.1 hypothetical protein DSM19430T_33410 [Desulfovibrio psychrotolerans]
MPESTFTFRVEDTLKAAFADAAKQRDRTAAQLLRDFMRSYVVETQSSDPAYDAWLHRKAEAGERDYRAGRLISQEEATAKAAQRKAAILSQHDTL